MITMGVNYKFGSGAPGASGSPGHGKYQDTDEGKEKLAKDAQNPIADLISVPFQNNTNFNVGPFNRAQNVLNIQPVVPLHLSNDWIVISRTIAPLTSQPDPVFNSSTFGIGDTSQSLILSPVSSGIKDFSWGLGPIVTVPTASNLILGTGKVLLGPEAVVIYTPGHWVIGAVVSNSWSVGGDPVRNSVNFFNTQPFINYNIPHGQGWYFTSCTNHYRRLERPTQNAMDRSFGRRHRPCVQIRRPGFQCASTSILQCSPRGSRQHQHARGLAVPLRARTAVP